MNDPSGLFSRNSEPIPLMGVSVKGDILGRGARVKIAQRFRNREEKAIEAVYKFPLPENAAICGFRALIDGRKIEGSVEEREKAFEIYDKALTRGDGGYLLDEERPNIFTLSVGNLKPKAEAIVEIEYVTLLETEGEKVRFFLPTTISPRYIPDGMPENSGIPENDKINPVYATDVPYGLSLNLNIHQGSQLASVESPTHPVRVNMLGEIFQASLSSDSVKMDRDFILYLAYKTAFINRAYRMRERGENFFQVDFTVGDEPGKEIKQGRIKEVIFVLDCSGSMEGDSIQEAKKALEICLKSLDEGNSFNIYRFGSNFEHLFQSPEKYSDKSLENALSYFSKAKADLGGTEVLGPLKHIYSLPPAPETERSIVLLTDGEVGNEGEVLDLVRNHQENTRFFPIWIGAGPNEFLIKGVARAGRGACEFIHPGERIEPKVLRAFQKLGEVALEELGIDWGKGSFDQAPQAPLCYSGSPVSIFARQADGEESQGRILKLHGKISGAKKGWEIPISDQGRGDSLPAPVLWAREKIRELEEGRDASLRGSRQADRKSKQVKDRIIELSKQYSLLSTLTSFVAVEEREEKDKSTGEIVLRKVPTLVTVGWHGMGRVLPSTVMASMAPSMAPMPVLHDRSISFRQVSEPYEDSEISFSISIPKKRPQKKEAAKTDLLMDILSLQKMQGGLSLNERVAEKFGIDLKKIRNLASAMELEISEDKFLIISTAILLQILRVHFLAEELSWKRVVRKSEAWLQKILETGKPTIKNRELMDWVEEYVKENVRQ